MHNYIWYSCYIQSFRNFWWVASDDLWWQAEVYKWTDGVTQLLDLLPPMAMQVKILHLLEMKCYQKDMLCNPMEYCNWQVWLYLKLITFSENPWCLSLYISIMCINILQTFKAVAQKLLKKMFRQSMYPLLLIWNIEISKNNSLISAIFLWKLISWISQ